MKPTKGNDDEPDVIDLTAFYGYYGSFNYPLRPPSPFADDPLRPHMSVKDNETDAVMTWSIPARQQSLTYKINNTEKPVLSSSSDSQSSHIDSKWRLSLNKLLKRTKSIDRKKVVSLPPMDYSYPYDFGIGDNTRTDILTSPSNSSKRVHWFDENEDILDSCQRFIECLTVLIQNIINDNIDENNYLENCQVSLERLQPLINYQEIKQVFNDMIELATIRDKNQLVRQQIYIESLLPRAILTPFA
ncbi:unnamed protein product [Adineta steineri]|uniref:Uncharacterized protein n=1 Tax=Adineta steineri TaxID=433720 RepID=A0A813V0R5_9BILA|nr:unnamed protein product [Adineta steineri]CAF0976432.1 unnamed protein product [Adineta steineri]